ncbi:MAG: hypothetical protein ACYDAE_19560, partial [Steroidobacteraceae bacterium]
LLRRRNQELPPDVPPLPSVEAIAGMPDHAPPHDGESGVDDIAQEVDPGAERAQLPIRLQRQAQPLSKEALDRPERYLE